MEQNPKISVVVPVYNVEHYVEKCFDSILNQTYHNLEIIIINDGSTDGSRDKCEKYLRTDDRVQLICKRHEGIAAARNAAVERATGEYIGFVDSDDWIAPDMYEMLYRNAVDYNADISECAVKEIYGSDNISTESEVEAAPIIYEGIEKLFDNIHRANNSLCNKLFRTSLFEGIRFPEGRIFEDLATTYRLIERANKIVVSSKEKYCYIFRNNSITHIKFDIHHMDVIWASIQRYQYITEKYPELEKECRNNVFTNLIWVINKAYINGYLENHTEELQEIVDSLRVYDYHDCGLSKEQESALRFMFRGLKSYYSALKMFAR